MNDNDSILMHRVGPDLYRTNAFRVAQIFVDATDAEIRRKTEKIKLALKYGKGNIAYSGFFQLKPDPDSDSLQEALERLRDPEKRLIEEFFWFWPLRIGQSAKDPALAFLKKRELQSAVNVWRAEEKRGNDHGVSKHNLAVIAHMTALDREHKYGNQKISGEAAQKLAQFWRHAFKRWSILINEEAFWGRLTERVREFNDPRLTRGTVERVRESLPQALLSINVSLAVNSAERDQMGEAQRQKSIVTSSGFSSSATDQALSRGTQSPRDRLKLLLETAKTDSESDIEHADGVCKRLLSETKPILKVVDLLLPVGHSMREAVHDDIAMQVLASQIPFANSTQNWKSSLQLLELAAPLAEGAAARQRISENIEIVRNNIQGSLCWFCKEEPAVEDAAYGVAMYGNVRQVGIQVQWQHGTIPIPRCTACKEVHEGGGKKPNESSDGDLACGCGCLLLIIGGILCAVFPFFQSETGLWYLGAALISLWVTFTLVLWIWKTVAGKDEAEPEPEPEPKETKPVEYAHEHPNIKTLLQQGWQFGKKPPGC